MVLFKIGELDITPFIVLNSYNISSQPEFDTWYDGNRLERRAIKRWKLKGSFEVKFFEQKDYQDFLHAIESQVELNSASYVRATVYDNKKRTTKEADVYIDYEPANLEPIAGHEDNEETEITITER